MNQEAITVRRLGGALGAEIRGIDLSGPLSERQLDAIHQALLDHMVIVFRGQAITPRKQVEIAAR